MMALAPLPVPNPRGFYRIEPPDLFYLRWTGHVPCEQTCLMLQAMAPVIEAAGHVYVLQDLTQMRSLEPSARALIASSGYARHFAALAAFGASFHLRVIAAMVRAGLKLFQGAEPPLGFFSTEAEARAWLAVERARRERRSSPSPAPVSSP